MSLYTIKSEDRTGYHYVHISGPESFDAAVLFWEELALLTRQESLKRILIEDQVDGRLSTLEIHRLSEIVSRLFRGVRVAFVDPKDETYEDNKFGETVVRNRAGIVKLFSSVESAESWLLIP